MNDLEVLLQLKTELHAMAEARRLALLQELCRLEPMLGISPTTSELRQLYRQGRLTNSGESVTIAIRD